MRYLSVRDIEPLIGKFQRLLDDEFGDAVLSLVLYGSAARGTASSLSDTDLLVVLEDTPPDASERIAQAHMALEKTAEYRRFRERGMWPMMSCLVLSRQEANEARWIFLDMIEDAVVLRDKDGFFRGRLARLRRRLAELGSKKVVLPDRSWYWNLKPDLRPGEAFSL